MSTSCCCESEETYECGPTSWPRFVHCHHVNQVVFRLRLWACEPSGPECDPSATCDYDEEEVVLVYDRDGATAYDFYAPKDGSVAANVGFETDGGVDYIRVEKLLLPDAIYEYNYGTELLEKTGGGDCCYQIGIEKITTRRLFDADTVAGVTFDVTIDGIASDDCTDCECYNGTYTTSSMDLVYLFGGYYFGARFYGSATAAAAGCITAINGVRSPPNFAVTIGVDSTLAESCYNECELCDGGSADDPPCLSCSGSVNFASGNCSGIIDNGEALECCTRSTIAVGAQIDCNELHPTLDPIEAGDFACTVDCYTEETACDCSAATITAVEN